MNIYSPIRNNFQLITLIAIGLAFIVLTTWFYGFRAPLNFSSPDETANYYFIRQLSEHNRLQVHDAFQGMADGLVRPRSIAYINGNFVPGSFLGMIVLYGLLAKIAPIAAIQFFTPVFSVLGVIFFYLLLCRIFQKNIAFISALLLYCLPPFWYYASRGLFHNVLFVVFLIIALYVLVIAFDNKSRKTVTIALFFCAGLLFGTAILVRTSEITWVLMVLLVIFLAKRRQCRIIIFPSFVIGLALPIVFLLIMNAHLYGSPLTFSYPLFQSESINGPESTTEMTVLTKFFSIILPFGIQWHDIGHSFYSYIISLIPWLTIPLIIGLLNSLRSRVVVMGKKFISGIPQLGKEINRKESVYLLIYFLISLWLVIYYGSFKFSEQYNHSVVLLGSSYVRYFLPIYIFGLPFAVNGIYLISSWAKSKKFSEFISIILLCFFVFASISMTVIDSQQGLATLRHDVQNNSSINSIISNKIANNAIIIAGYADKIFFPTHQVIVSLPMNLIEARNDIKVLENTNPVYFYKNNLDQSSNISEALLKQPGYILEPITGIDSGAATLYQVSTY